MATLLFATDTINIVAMCHKKNSVNVLVKVVHIVSFSPNCIIPGSGQSTLAEHVAVGLPHICILTTWRPMAS